MTRMTDALVLAALLLTACGNDAVERTAAVTRPDAGPVLTVRDTTIVATFVAAGIADPIERATLSTRLMGSVTAVLVQEGDRVTAGQLLARLDARDLTAKRTEADAGISAAAAMAQDATVHADRIRALYADSAATRSQLDQAESGLARAEAALRAATAGRAGVDALGAYAEIRAPFRGVITRRFVDAGGFVTPGSPILSVQNTSQLRVSVTIPPSMTAGLRAGTPLEATIEGRPAVAIVEGVVPAEAGAMYTVNALVDNAQTAFLSGSAATLRVPAGTQRTILIPRRALAEEGDLTGVQVQSAGGAELRWVKLGPTVADTLVEILSGLQAGDVILLGRE